MIIVVSCLLKHSIVDGWQDSEYASGSEYPRILNRFLVLSLPGFWIYQSSACASSFEYARNGFELSHIYKIIDIQSLSSQLYEIVIDYMLTLANVTPKQCSGAILIRK